MPVGPSVFARGSVHRHVCACGEIVPQNEPAHLLVLSLHRTAKLPFGRQAIPEFGVGADALLVSHREVGFVREYTPSRHEVQFAKSLPVRSTHAIGDGRITMVPPPPLGRVWIRVHPVENAHHGFRLLPRPHRAHVDDAIGSSGTIHGGGCRLDDLHLPHVFHGQIRPPDFAQIS